MFQSPAPCPSLVFLAPIHTLRLLPNSLRADVHNLFSTLYRFYNTENTSQRRVEGLRRILAVAKLVLRRNGRGEPRNRNKKIRVCVHSQQNPPGYAGKVANFMD